MKNLKKIAIVGVEGSGKTVMLASLGGYYTQTTDEPVFLIPKDDETSSYVHRQIRKIEGGEWPAATESDNLQGLDWTLMRRRGARAPETLCELSCLDFGGEVYRAAYGSSALHDGEGLSDEIVRLKDYVRAADGVVVLINLKDIVENKITERVEESMRISAAILNDVFNRKGRGRKRKVQAVLALSMASEYADTINAQGGPVGTLRKYLPEIANQFSFLEVIRTHSVEKDLDDDGNVIPTRFSADGLRPLMNWIVACAEGKDLTVKPGDNPFEGGRSAKVETMHLTDYVSLDMVYCAPGKFVMGSPENEEGRTCDDETQHEVMLTQGFWIGKFPVTQEQWACVMHSDPSFRKDLKCPVESVSWNDCQEFLSKLGDRCSRKLRLPTEAEWEYACRARTESPFGAEDVGDVVWYRENAAVKSAADGEAREVLQTHPVGQKKPNRIGLYDMHGNVWEWCSDFYGEYPEDAVTDPTGPDNGTERVVRGGAYNNAANFCRAAYRQRHAPDYKMRNLGFRVCFTASDAEMEQATSDPEPLPVRITGGIERRSVKTASRNSLPTEPVDEVPEPVKSPVMVSDGLPLTEDALSKVGTPHGIVLDGELIRTVISWKDCYRAFCEKLMTIDAGKFDALPDDPTFKRFFVRAIPHKKYPDCYPMRCGTVGDVRAKEVNGAFHFYNPIFVVHKLLDLYGIDPARVTIVR